MGPRFGSLDLAATVARLRAASAHQAESICSPVQSTKIISESLARAKNMASLAAVHESGCQGRFTPKNRT